MTIPADTTQERAFGRSVGLVLFLIGLYQFWRGRSTAGLSFTGVGTVLMVLGTFAPAALRVPSMLWWKFSHVLGWVNSRIILSIFFFLILTPIGLFFRLTGRDPLSQRGKDSTWSPYPARKRDHYEHLF